MAKRGHNRKRQKAHRVRSENADSVIFGLKMSPEELTERIDGRHKTRKIAGKRQHDLREEIETLRSLLPSLGIKIE